MNEPMKQIGRLAFREEGDTWNAYYALTGTMVGALYLGSIKMAIVTVHPERRKAFMDLMWEGVADIIEEKVGVRPSRKSEVVAPEHERTKRA